MKKTVMMMVCGVFAATCLAVCAEEPRKSAEPAVATVSPGSGSGSNAPYVPSINRDADLPRTSNFETELSQPSRSVINRSGTIEWNERDVAFSKYVDVSLLSRAMAMPSLDASHLIDVALGLSEGERVLVRTHESGLTADNLMAKAVKLAVSSGDAASQERIGKAATAHGREQWTKLLTDAKEFGGASRDGATVSINKIDGETAALIQDVRQACNVAMLTGNKAELEAVKNDVAASKADESIKSHLCEQIEGNLKSIPDTADDTQKLLAEFSARSRGWDFKPPRLPTKLPKDLRDNVQHYSDVIDNTTKNTPFDPRTLPDAAIPSNTVHFESVTNYSYALEIALRNYTDHNVVVKFSGGRPDETLQPGWGWDQGLRFRTEGLSANAWIKIKQPNGNWGQSWLILPGRKYRILNGAVNGDETILTIDEGTVPTPRQGRPQLGLESN